MRVAHYGPSPHQVGGMETLLALIEERRIGAEAVSVHPTVIRGRRAVSAWLAVKALAGLPFLRADLVHVHLSIKGSFVREGAILRSARRLGFPTAVTLHGAEFADQWRAWPRLTVSTLRQADLVLTLNPDDVPALERVTESIVAYVPNPAVIDADAPPCALTDPVVLFAGSLSLRKGVDLLGTAWPRVRAEVPDAELVLVGPPRDAVAPSGPGITVLPAASPAAVRALLLRARCAVLPSRAEALPMFLIEAMACARPFVATPVGGVASLAAGGTLVPVDDADALARALTGFLRDPAAAEEVGRRGQRSAAETRSVELVDRRWRELYAAAVLRRRRRDTCR